jgi:hypothetical protein
MIENRRAFWLFVAVQTAGLVAASMTSGPWRLLQGIVPAQAALVAIWLAIGPVNRKMRRVGAIVAAVLFFSSAVSLAFDLPAGWLLGQNGYGWQFLMLMVRVLVVGAFYWQMRERKGYVLSTSGGPISESLLRFRLHHVFMVMAFVAVFFVVTGNSGGGAFYSLLLVVYIALLGLAYAGMSLLASLLMLEQRRTLGRVAAYVAGIGEMSVAIAAHAYLQSDGWPAARHYWLEAMVEVAWLCTSLGVARLRLSPSPVVVGEADENPADVAVWKPSIRFSLKALFVVFTLAALWLGWNVSTVQERKRLRAMLDGRPGNGGVTGFVTYDEGNAAAPQAVKRRIAPIVSDAFNIRNRGGNVTHPRAYGDLSIVRRWLGDELVFIILLDGDSPLREDAKDAFPEAMIVIRDGREIDAR